MSPLWPLVPLLSLLSTLPVVHLCCLPRQIRFDILVTGREEFAYGETYDYSENRSAYYDEDRDCSLIRGTPFGIPMEILTNYTSGIEYTVMDQCEMRAINTDYERVCLPSNAMLQETKKIPGVKEVSVYRANITDPTGVLQREYGVVHEGDSCYFLWWSTTGRVQEFGMWKTFSENLTYRNIRTMSGNDHVFEIPGKCRDDS